jgi:hypothetical protein
MGESELCHSLDLAGRKQKHMCMRPYHFGTSENRMENDYKRAFVSKRMNSHRIVYMDSAFQLAKQIRHLSN